MSGVGNSVIKQVGDQKVVCSELTVEQVRGLLLERPVVDLVDELLLEGIRLSDLPMFTGLSLDELNKMLPSALEEIAAGCKEANPSFFRMLARVAKPAQLA